MTRRGLLGVVGLAATVSGQAVAGILIANWSP
jgi:hypothetical protein